MQVSVNILIPVNSMSLTFNKTHVRILFDVHGRSKHRKWDYALETKTVPRPTKSIGYTLFDYQKFKIAQFN